MLRESGLLDDLQQSMQQTPNGVYSLYGDPAYPLSPYLLAPFGGATRTPAEAQFNKSMSVVRVTVEWAFGHTTGLFPIVDFRKNLKVLLQPVVFIILLLLFSVTATLASTATRLHHSLIWFLPHLKTICSKFDV